MCHDIGCCTKNRGARDHGTCGECSLEFGISRDHEKNLQFNVSHDNEKSLSSNSRNSIIMVGPTFLVQFGLLRVSLLWTFEDGDGEVTLDEFLDEHGHKADLLR
jgi:hypothetical protein